MSQFYLTLPSNTTNIVRGKREKRDVVSLDSSGNPVDDTLARSVYQVDSSQSTGQSLNNYRVRLAQRIRLEGDWEVALAEVTYPHSWFNFNKGDAVLKITTKPTTRAAEKVHILCEIYPNQYSDAEQLVGALNFNYNFALDEHVLYGTISAEVAAKLKVSFSYQRELRRILIKVSNPEIIDQITMSPHLLYVLGFEQAPQFKTATGYLTKVVAKYPVDLKAGFYAMYIYCNLVANQMVGDTLVPLLRTVTVEGNHEDVVCKVYNTPHYIPLSQREFDSVEISINDDQNKPVKFQFGKVITKLHFRRRRPDLF